MTNKNCTKTAGVLFCVLLSLRAGSAEQRPAYNRAWLIDKNIIESARIRCIKDEVSRIIKKLESVARHENGLDSFGQDTMAEASDMLELGNDSAPVLAAYLDNSRKVWMVRYWVVDILGYNSSMVSVNALQKIIYNKKENFEVRTRAISSLNQVLKAISAIKHKT